MLCIESELVLPKFKKIRYRNEMDRFGFSACIRDLLNLSVYTPAFCNWMHGWHWWPIVEFKYSRYSELRDRNIPTVVNTEEHYKVLRRNGINAKLGPLPYYVVSEFYKEFLNTLSPKIEVLVMAQKYTTSTILSAVRKNLISVSDLEKLLLRLMEMGVHNSSIVVCLYNEDMRLQEIRSLIYFYQVRWVCGASPDDENGLLRMNSIFKQSSLVVSNTIGSFVPYSMLHTRFCLIAPIQDVLPKHCKITDQEHIWHKYAEKLYIEQNFSNLVSSQLNTVIQDLEYAHKELGSEYMMSLEEISKLFGWSSRLEMAKNYLGWKGGNWIAKFR